MKNFSLYLNLKTRIVEFSFGTKKIFFYLTLQGVNPSYTPSRLVLLFCFRFVDIVPRVSARLSIITNQKNPFPCSWKIIIYEKLLLTTNSHAFFDLRSFRSSWSFVAIELGSVTLKKHRNRVRPFETTPHFLHWSAGATVFEQVSAKIEKKLLILIIKLRK